VQPVVAGFSPLLHARGGVGVGVGVEEGVGVAVGVGELLPPLLLPPLVSETVSGEGASYVDAPRVSDARSSDISPAVVTPTTVDCWRVFWNVMRSAVELRPRQSKEKLTGGVVTFVTVPLDAVTSAPLKVTPVGSVKVRVVGVPL
jgi:hypothetical protein